MRWASVLAAGLFVGTATAADLSAVDRTIRKEPAYAGKPRYCLLAFGPDARDRVWLVHDGDSLYVDRNGNGDLTDPGEKVAAAADGPKENGWSFAAGDLSVGGKVHKGLGVTLTPLKRYAASPSLADVAAVRNALKADPAAAVAALSVNVDSPRFTGTGIGRRIVQSAGFYDLNGVLTFAATPAAAPAVHFDGPLQVNFYGEVPGLRTGRTAEFILAVGTPGKGGGTFAMLEYQDTIPAGVYPTVEITYPGEPPMKELFELKLRC